MVESCLVVGMTPLVAGIVGAVEVVLERTGAGVESNSAAPAGVRVYDAARMEATAGVAVEMAASPELARGTTSAEVGIEVAEDGSPEAVPLGARSSVVERVVDRAVAAAAVARAR